MRFVRTYYRSAIIAALLLAIGAISVPIIMRMAMRPYTYASIVDVPTAEVADFVRQFHGGHANISPMIDQWMIFRCEVFVSNFAPFGLRVFGTTDRKLKWREAFRQTGIEWTGAAAHAVLKTYLWPADYDDLFALLDRYPQHVVELTACERTVGVIPGRRACFWECRLY